MYFDEILASQDVAEIWGIDSSTVRRAIANDRLIIGEDCQKYGRQWVLNIDAVCRLWGVSPLYSQDTRLFISPDTRKRLIRQYSRGR